VACEFNDDLVGLAVTRFEVIKLTKTRESTIQNNRTGADFVRQRLRYKQNRLNECALSTAIRTGKYCQRTKGQFSFFSN